MVADRVAGPATMGSPGSVKYLLLREYNVISEIDKGGMGCRGSRKGGEVWVNLKLIEVDGNYSLSRVRTNHVSCGTAIG